MATKIFERYRHDCRDCIYLGPHGKADLYVHQDSGNYIETVIAVYGVEADYVSGLPLVDFEPDLAVALARAKSLRLTTKPNN